MAAVQDSTAGKRDGPSITTILFCLLLSKWADNDNALASREAKRAVIGQKAARRTKAAGMAVERRNNNNMVIVLESFSTIKNERCRIFYAYQFHVAVTPKRYRPIRKLGENSIHHVSIIFVERQDNSPSHDGQGVCPSLLIGKVLFFY